MRIRDLIVKKINECTRYITEGVNDFKQNAMKNVVLQPSPTFIFFVFLAICQLDVSIVSRKSKRINVEGFGPATFANVNTTGRIVISSRREWVSSKTSLLIRGIPCEDGFGLNPPLASALPDIDIAIKSRYRRMNSYIINRITRARRDQAYAI